MMASLVPDARGRPVEGKTRERGPRFLHQSGMGTCRCGAGRLGLDPRRNPLMTLTRIAAATAPALFVVLWSTGFIGARYGLPYIEPMTFLGVRMLFVVAIMLAIAFVSGARWPDARETGHSLATGAMVHFLYLGGVFVAISQGVP